MTFSLLCLSWNQHRSNIILFILFLSIFYREGDEVKIQPFRKRNLVMEIVEDYNRLYNDENSKYVVTKVTLKNTSVDEKFTKQFGFSVGKILHKKNDAAFRHGF